jgi:hypothetical protein
MRGNIYASFSPRLSLSASGFSPPPEQHLPKHPVLSREEAPV